MVASVALEPLGTDLLGHAREHHSKRASKTVVSGNSQRATLIALADGGELGKHDSPSAATLQILSGQVRLLAVGQEWELSAGDLIAVPPERHAVRAEGDATFLLTVALH